MPAEGQKAPTLVTLLGVPILNANQGEILKWIADRIRSGEPCHIVTTNIDLLLQAWRDPEMHRIHLEADLVIADGMPLVWLSGLFGPALKERIAGSDLVPALGTLAAERGWSMYGVGAGPGVAERALKKLQELNPGLKVAGWESPPVGPLLQMGDDILDQLKKAKPDILLVALGSPKQEKWIRLHFDEWTVPIAIGVGASLDFLAGAQLRAPRWMGLIGLEWFWRMLANPRRLFKRYFVDAFFLFYMLSRLILLRILPRSNQPTWSGADPERVDIRGGKWVVFKPCPLPDDAHAYFKANEPVAQKYPLVVDLTGIPWLGSVELSALINLSRTCRRSTLRLFLVGVSPRVERLIRLSKLDRYLEMPGSRDDLERELNHLKAASESKVIRLNRMHHRLQLVLPKEFTRELVERIRETFVGHWATGKIKEVVIDARGMEYIDSGGSRLLLAIRRMVEQDPARTMWLLGFPEEVLKRMRREGLGTARIDRRKTFRKTVFPTPP
jgi:N-acetylglucosaminyldiphosphoundecaprenol N-acetyl-beta-D-mannosaminyltransferase